MVLDVTAKDFLMELRDNGSDGDLGFKIDTSVVVGAYNSTWTEANKDLKGKVWSTGISTRGGLIKSFISKTTDNLTVTGDANRFVDSVKKFVKNTTYRLGDRNNKSFLAHIASLAAEDSHNATGEQLFGYDYYPDPNFTSTSTSHKPTAMFNYFKRGTRPNAVPATYGLNIEQPYAGGFAPSGRLHAMLDFDFERPKGEIFTEASTKFPYTVTSAEGTAATEVLALTFEALQIKGEVSIESIRCTPFTTTPTGGTLLSTHSTLAHGANDPTLPLYFAEWMRVKLDGSGDYDETSGTLTTIARIQYVNKTQNETINDDNPAYVLITEVDSSINSTAFADGVKWYGKEATGSSITLKSRPRTKYGVKRTAKIDLGSVSTMDDIREQVAAALIRGSNQTVRGNFQCFEKPRFYIDNSPTSVSGTTTQTITLSGSVNPLNYGFREGMVVMELDSDGEPTATYGYASSVSSTQVVVTWATGQISDSDTVRYYVPVRAGDVINVRNDLVNVNGIYLVTKVTYTEQPGVGSTRYDVVGQEDLTVGGGARKTFAATAFDKANQQMNLPMRQAQAAAMASALVTCTFSATTNGTVVDADGVYWTDGNLSIGIDQYAIVSGTTITTMVTAANGNTGQATDGTAGALASDVDYYIYYPGTGTALKTIRRAAYINVNDEDTILLGQCKAGTTKAEFTLFASTFKNNPVEGVRENSLGNLLTKKGAQPWSTDIKFEGTDYHDIRWYKAQNSDGSAVSGTSTAGSISFGDDTTETINAGNINALADASTYYIYKTVGDSASATLTATQNYAQAYRDDRVLLALVTVADGDDLSESPTIMPFNGNVQTISATAIAALSITAGNIAATALDAHTITLATGGKFVTASGLSRTGTDNWTSMAGGGTGGGVVIDQYGILGTSKSDDNDINDTEFYLEADSGKALFGGGICTLSSGGLVIGNGEHAAGSSTGFLKWTAPSLTDAFIYRLQADNGYSKGTVIFNTQQSLVVVQSTIPGGTANYLGDYTGFHQYAEIHVKKLMFQSIGTTYNEFATIESPTNYTGSDSTSARYRIILPTSIGSANEVLKINSISLTTGLNMDWAADATSSLRYKENITSLNIDTAKIFNLVPKSFTWKEDMAGKILDPKGSDRPSFGYIAEEVEKIIPEILGYDEENKPKQLDYKLLSVLLLEEVKKLKTRVDLLEGR
mgnify:CR=1 FL=1